jgi:hypothetical protein
VLGAYLDERLCGIVHYLFHRSCWTTGDYCYLQESPASEFSFSRCFHSWSFAFVHARIGVIMGRAWDRPGMFRRPITLAVSRCKASLVCA